MAEEIQLSSLSSQVVEVLKQMAPLLPTYGHLIVSAVFPIYAAAHASLIRPSSAAKPKRKPGKPGSGETDDEQEEKSGVIESLTPSDALLFPLLAGATLASLYFILKWLQDPYLVNTILSLYFSWIGVFFVFKFLRDVLTTIRSFVFPSTYSSASWTGSRVVWTADPDKSVYTTTRTSTGSTLKTNTGSPLPGILRHIPLGRWLSSKIWGLRRVISTPAALHMHIFCFLDVDTTITLLDVMALTWTCVLVGIHTFVDKPWYLTNLMGFSFCYSALQFTTPTTGTTGTLILCALFLYDIYFVFYTPMMVTVATKLDVPIKLLFPQPHGCVVPPPGSPDDSALMQEYRQCVDKSRAMAMLGLGDIVVPGMMIAFALRFDLFLHYYRLQRRQQQHINAKKEGRVEAEIVKTEYRSATGSWGERFWTAQAAWSSQLRAKSFRKRYFHATLVGYVAGLVVTLVALQVMRHGQPALLYLVPGVLGMFWGTALVSGDLKTLWNYHEGDDEEEEERKKKEEKDGAKEADKEGQKDGEDTAPVADSKDDDDDDIKLIDFSITIPAAPRRASTVAATAVATDKS